MNSQGDEGDLLAAGAFDATRADNAKAIGVEDDLEQDGQRVTSSTNSVIGVAGIKNGLVESVINEMVEDVDEGAGNQLPLKIDSKETRAGVDRLVASHALSNL